MAEFKYIRNGDIIQYRGKYYTVNGITLYSNKDEAEELTVDATENHEYDGFVNKEI